MDTLNTRHENNLYRQGVANLELEGMHLSLTQHKLALLYQNGRISHAEFIAQTIAYARSK